MGKSARIVLLAGVSVAVGVGLLTSTGFNGPFGGGGQSGSGGGGGGGVTAYSWTASYDFDPFLGPDCYELTTTATGALTTDAMVVANLGDILGEDIAFLANATSYGADTVTIRVCCTRLSGCTNPPAIDLTVKTFR